MIEPQGFPVCRKCGEGDLVPLSDFGSQGAAVMYKAWVCTNPSCSYNLKIRNGDVYVNEPITDVSLAPPAPAHAVAHGGFRSIR
ncbi:MAG TPA: hypothetical protein VHS99_14180 [Chloroflexota bacterium]|nr:hypothetical protein [Chloroflexota bacterium]